MNEKSDLELLRLHQQEPTKSMVYYCDASSNAKKHPQTLSASCFKEGHKEVVCKEGTHTSTRAEFFGVMEVLRDFLTTRKNEVALIVFTDCQGVVRVLDPERRTEKKTETQGCLNCTMSV